MKALNLICKLIESKDPIKLFSISNFKFKAPFKNPITQNIKTICVEDDTVYMILDIEEYDNGLAVVLRWNNDKREVFAISENLFDSYFSYSLLSTLGYRSHFVKVDQSTNTDIFISEYTKDSSRSNALKTLVILTVFVFEQVNDDLRCNPEYVSEYGAKQVEIAGFRLQRICKTLPAEMLEVFD